MTRIARLALLIVAFTAAPALAEEETHRQLVSPEVSEMIWSLVTFLIFFGLLSVLVWPKILKGLRAREGQIRADLTGAEQSAKQAAATLEEYRKQLAAAGVEARRIIEQGSADAHKLAASLQAQAQAEIEGARKRAQADIAAAREQAVAELYAQAATLATDVAGKILRREIRPEDQTQLINDSLAAIKRGDNN